VEFLIDRDDPAGPVNIAAPNPLPNRRVHAGPARCLGHAEWYSIPWPLLEIGAFLMRTESELVLKSRRVVPGRLLAAGFQFDFKELVRSPPMNLVRQWRNRE